MAPVLYVPDGTMTCPPPWALTVSMARLNAAVLSAEPLPLAPKLVTLKVASGIIGNAVSDTMVRAAAQGSSSGSTRTPMPVAAVSAPRAARPSNGTATAPPATVSPVMSACRREIRPATVTPHGRAGDDPPAGRGYARWTRPAGDRQAGPPMSRCASRAARRVALSARRKPLHRLPQRRDIVKTVTGCGAPDGTPRWHLGG